MNIPLNEYPRPQLKRDSYLSLNGYWNYLILNNEKKIIKKGKILVPFSPECELSEVGHILKPNELLIYEKSFDFSSFDKFDKLILHFDKVDQVSSLYLNDVLVKTNNNGYLPFEVDIKEFINDLKNVNVRLEVKDYTDTSFYLRGKQKLKRGGIFYTPQSGIYMPVWVEGVNKNYIKKIKITPDLDNNSLKLTVFSNSNNVKVKIENKEHIVSSNKENEFKINNIIPWEPENPFLYDLEISSDDDKVSSYFAMRKFSTMKDKNGITRLALNNKPLFMKGVLDQGYYSKSLLTPSCDQDYIDDLLAIKNMGFNVTRKHIKIESLRFYYHADRLGVIVWQDFLNGGEGDINLVKHFIFEKLTPHRKDTNYRFFKRRSIEGRKNNEEEFYQIIELLYNCPSIGLWTIFNEGWGQFDSKKIYMNCLKIDNTRIYDHASGWYDQRVSDVKSLHVYFKRVKMPRLSDVNNRAVILSECGGYSLKIDGHYHSKKEFGYKKMKDVDELLSNYQKFIDLDVKRHINEGLSAFIYTELSDVEDELNGFLTYDRKIKKIPFEKIKAINDSVKLD